jgi:hypothetical protein
MARVDKREVRKDVRANRRQKRVDKRREFFKGVGDQMDVPFSLLLEIFLHILSSKEMTPILCAVEQYLSVEDRKRVNEFKINGDAIYPKILHDFYLYLSYNGRTIPPNEYFKNDCPLEPVNQEDRQNEFINQLCTTCEKRMQRNNLLWYDRDDQGDYIFVRKCVCGRCKNSHTTPMVYITELDMFDNSYHQPGMRLKLSNYGLVYGENVLCKMEEEEKRQEMLQEQRMEIKNSFQTDSISDEEYFAITRAGEKYRRARKFHRVK